MHRALLAFASAIALTVLGCGGAEGPADDGPDGGSASCPLYTSTADLTTPTVSFQTDVMPIFQGSCQTSSCHGSMTAPEGGLFLGEPTAKGSDAATVYAGLVGKKSQELATMDFVASGGGASSPTNSYLMHKLDGDQCAYASQCVGDSCFALMPDGEGLLPVATRDTIRRWIFQGAASN
jgi:hypothetical protein